MAAETPPETWPKTEWHFVASRINDIVTHLEPHLTMNMFGAEPGLGPRARLTYGMHIEQVTRLHPLLEVVADTMTGSDEAA